MQDYESKHVAWWGYALACAVAVGGLAFVWYYGSRAPESLVGVGLVVVAFLVSNFAVLTVRVDDREVRWFFGRGPIGKRIALDRIEDAEARRSPWYWGWGIRWTPRGWLWRSTGLDAVWLRLTNGKQIGVGTPDPEGLARAVRDRLRAVVPEQRLEP